MFTEAKAGDHRCYTRFNPTGNFNGNCGRDESTGEYLKCEDEYVENLTPHKVNFNPSSAEATFVQSTWHKDFWKLFPFFFILFVLAKLAKNIFQ